VSKQLTPIIEMRVDVRTLKTVIGRNTGFKDFIPEERWTADCCIPDNPVTV